MRIKYVGVLVLAARLLFFLGACGDSDDDPVTPETEEVIFIKIGTPFA